MDLLDFKDKKSYIRPLFWQHGESREALVEEIKQMYDNGVGGFIVEARPHPDFLSYGWWRDLDIIIDEAKRREMEVWLFDDSSYPSGLGAGKIKTLYPEYVKTYMAEHHIDVIGPKRNATINVRAWLEASEAEGVHNLSANTSEELLCVLLAKRKNGRESLEADTIIDLTHDLHNGKIEVDLEEGSWRIFLITKTSNGGEDWTKDYVDPLSHEAVSKYIDIIYEEHYKRYANEFGDTIKGFFTDEPRFGNVAGYEDIMWKPGIVYPYTEGLIDKLSSEFGKDIRKYLPFLWSDEDPMCHDVHYCYMNVVTKLFADNFTGQIGDWCRSHQVGLTGHLVEDNGVHARLGYGPGHFFRVMEGMDSAGMDLVYQVWPKHIEGRFTTPFGYLDAEFFYWGIAKMTSSSAHLDQKKKGLALCEIFGAYGWQMGLRFMKWLTDHVAVRGINLLVPHAFSPKYPDADCPPHFYAKGENPQWPFFHLWAGYANRVCSLLSDGTHHATAAVLYHAEAEWGGAYEPFEKVVRVLAEEQIDSDIVPIDYLIDPTKSQVSHGKLCINQEQYGVLIIPYTQCISQDFLNTITKFLDDKLPVIFMKDYPEKIYYREDFTDLLSLNHRESRVCDYETLIPYMRQQRLYDARLEKREPYLRIYHYEKEHKNLYFITNEDNDSACSNRVTLPEAARWVAYDAMEDQLYDLKKDKDKANTYHIDLAPYQSMFILEGEGFPMIDPQVRPTMHTEREIILDQDWQVSIQEDGKKQVIEGLTTLKNIASHNLYPEYSGIIAYQRHVSLTPQGGARSVYLDLGEVYEISRVFINGKAIGTKIVPPYIYDLTSYVDEDCLLEVEVVNTFAKAKGDNYFDRSMVQEPSGLLGPVKLKFLSLGGQNEKT